MIYDKIGTMRQKLFASAKAPGGADGQKSNVLGKRHVGTAVADIGSLLRLDTQLAADPKPGAGSGLSGIPHGFPE